MIAANPNANRPEFEPGQLVRHRRYGYRGVVVRKDASCLADEDWYRNNQTQPDRDQPWYHVLVNDSTACTYAAAENLIADHDPSPINHPLVTQFFSNFHNGRYLLRNPS